MPASQNRARVGAKLKITYCSGSTKWRVIPVVDGLVGLGCLLEERGQLVVMKGIELGGEVGRMLVQIATKPWRLFADVHVPS